MPPDNSDVSAAISAALSFDWAKARQINSRILKNCPDDVDCLNRLGKSHLELGEVKKAAACFRKVLKINKYDPIATKNLARLTEGGKSKNGSGSPSFSSTPKASSFIEEPGKTKLVALVNTAPAKVLFSLGFAKHVRLVPRRHTILVTDEKDNYLGAVPDDVSHRLFLLMQGGNTYEAVVKSVSKNLVTILIREVSRAKKFRNTPSFPLTGSADYLSYVREDVPLEELVSVPEKDTESDEADEDHVSKRHFDEEVEEE